MAAAAAGVVLHAWLISLIPGWPEARAPLACDGKTRRGSPLETEARKSRSSPRHRFSLGPGRRPGAHGLLKWRRHAPTVELPTTRDDVLAGMGLLGHWSWAEGHPDESDHRAELNSYGKVPEGMMVNIVIVATANYLWGAAVTVRSALEACSTTLNVYAICVDLTQDDKQQLSNSWQASNIGTISFIDFDLERVNNFRTTLLVKSKSPYARFFIPEYLVNVSRCIYLDTDLIVCSDLAELQLLDLHGKSSACVIDGGIDTPQQQQRLRDKLKLENPHQYFNSGVIVMDLDAWRRHEIQSKALVVAQDNYDLLDQMDQDALNIVLAGDWLVLDPKWNTSKGKADADFSDGIIHFLGKVKPWHADYAANFQDRWFELLDRTAFAGQRPAKLFGAGVAYRRFVRSIPTLEMVKGKLRRLMRSA